MSLGVLEPFLQRFDVILLLFLRVMGLFVTAPVFSNRLVPVQMRIALAFGVAMSVSPIVKTPPEPTSMIGLIPIAVQELMVGLIMGFIAALIFSALQLAGQILDINMGFSIMNVLDPMTNTQVPLLGNLLYITALLIFFIVGGHRQIITAIMDSYAIVPLGTGALSPSAAEFMVAVATKMFVIGFKVAAPVMATLVLTIIALGILNRAVPQLNVFVIGLPVQMAVGVFMLMIVMPLYVSFLHVLFGGMFDDLLTVLRLLKE